MSLNLADINTEKGSQQLKENQEFINKVWEEKLSHTCKKHLVSIINNNIINNKYRHVCVDNNLLELDLNAISKGTPKNEAKISEMFSHIYLSENFQKILLSRVKMPPSEIKEYLLTAIKEDETKSIQKLEHFQPKTGFIISPQKEVKGRVTAQISEHKVLICLARLTKIKDENKTLHYDIILMGNIIPKQAEVIDRVLMPFYIYEFISEDLKYLLFSLSPLNTGQAIVRGNKYFLSANQELSKDLKVKVDTPALVVFDSDVLNESYDEEGVKGFLEDFSEEDIRYFVFNCYRQPKGYEWFEDLGLIFMFSSEYNGFPLHLGILGGERCNKTTFTENIHRAVGETQPIIGGESSRLKSLVPSYKCSPPEPGAFISSSDICCVDEFFKLVQVEANADWARCASALQSMNSLLEHKTRSYSSGNGKLGLKTTPGAKLLLNSNFSDFPNCSGDSAKLSDLLDDKFMSFLERIFFVLITKNHKDALVKSRKVKKHETASKIESEDFKLFYKFFKEHPVVFSPAIEELVNNLHSEVSNKVIPDNNLLKRYFCSNTTMIDSLFKLLDGIVKIRIIKTKVIDFNANAGDIAGLEFLVKRVVNTWLNSEVSL